MNQLRLKKKTQCFQSKFSHKKECIDFTYQIKKNYECKYQNANESKPSSSGTENTRAAYTQTSPEHIVHAQSHKPHTN